MATEAHYECLKEIFDRETDRHERLIDRGKVFLSVITLYLGLLGVAADDVIPKIGGQWLSTAAHLGSFGAFVVRSPS